MTTSVSLRSHGRFGAGSPNGDRTKTEREPNEPNVPNVRRGREAARSSGLASPLVLPEAGLGRRSSAPPRPSKSWRRFCFMGNMARPSVSILLCGAFLAAACAEQGDDPEAPTGVVVSEDGRVTLEGVPPGVGVSVSNATIEGIVAGLIYDFDPEDLVLEPAAELTFTLPEGVPADSTTLSRVIEVRFEGGGREPALLEVETEAVDQTLTARIRRLGTYAVTTLPPDLSRISDLRIEAGGCGLPLSATWEHDGSRADPRDYIYIETITLPGNTDTVPSDEDRRWKGWGAVSAFAGKLDIDDLERPSTGATHHLRAWYGTKVGGSKLAKTPMRFPAVFAEPCQDREQSPESHVLTVTVSGDGEATVLAAETGSTLGACRAATSPCTLTFPSPAAVQVVTDGPAVLDGCDGHPNSEAECRAEIQGSREISVRFVPRGECDALDPPAIEIEGAEILSGGQFARVRSDEDQPRVNVLARGRFDGSFYLEPARFEWTEYSLDPEGFFPVGSTQTLTDHRLRCYNGDEHCLLRLLVEDRCGTRVAELPYSIVRP